jgi:hypothetical protein
MIKDMIFVHSIILVTQNQRVCNLKWEESSSVFLRRKDYLILIFDLFLGELIWNILCSVPILVVGWCVLFSDVWHKLSDWTGNNNLIITVNSIIRQEVRCMQFANSLSWFLIILKWINALSNAMERNWRVMLRWPIWLLDLKRVWAKWYSYSGFF